MQVPLYRALNYIEPCATPPSPLLLNPSTIYDSYNYNKCGAGRGYGRREEDDAQSYFAPRVRAEVRIPNLHRWEVRA